MVERDREEERAVKVGLIQRYSDISYGTEKRSVRHAEARTETKKTGVGVDATVSSLHHAGAALTTAHPAHHGVGGQVHPRPSGGRSHSGHIWRGVAVL